MTKKTDIIGSELLDEYWHATARAPRDFPGQHTVDGTYEQGIDVLGALGARYGASRPKKPVKKPSSIANRAMSGRASTVANKVVDKKSPSGSKLASQAGASRLAAAGNRALAMGALVISSSRRGKRAGAKIGAKTIEMGKRALAQAGKSVPKASAVTNRLTTKVRGDSSDTAPVSDEILAQQTEAWAALSVIVDQMNKLIEAVSQADTTVADEGTALIDNTSIAFYGPEFNEVLADFKPRAGAWMEKAKKIVDAKAETTPTDNNSAPAGGGAPSGGGGGAGEGGGAGGGESGGAGGGDEGEGGSTSDSEAVQRFRESGGEWDPFADEAEEGPAPQEAAEEGEAPAEGISVDEEGNVLDDEGNVLDDQGRPVARRMQGKELLEQDEEVTGIGPGDYHFEWTDLLMPHQGLQRTVEEGQERAAELAAQPYTPGGTAEGKAASDDPRVARAKKRLAMLKRKQALALVARLAAAKERASRADAALQAADAAEATSTEDGGSTVMGDNFDPFDDDLHVRAWQRQITDDPPDPIRRRASVHRGDAYLDPNYPPWGASSGQEGGEMLPDETVDVMGGNYSHGIDVLGALPAAQSKVATTRATAASVARTLKSRGVSTKAAEAGGKAAAKVEKRAGFVKRVTPRGRTYTALAVKKTKDSKQIIANAKDAGKRAIAVGKKLQDALKKKPATTKATVQHALKTAVHGAVLRARGAAPKKGRVHVSPAQAAKLARELVTKTGPGTIKKAETHEKFVSSYTAKSKAGVLAAKKHMTPGGGTRVHGEEDIFGLVHDIAAAECDVLGAELLADFIVGLGEDAAAAEEMTPPADEGYADESADAAASGIASGPPDYGVGSAPTLESVTAELAAEAVQEAPGGIEGPYDGDLPPGAVPFVWADRKPPFKAIASYATFFGKGPGGQEPEYGTDGDGVGGGFEWHGDEGSRWMIYKPRGSSAHVFPPQDDGTGNDYYGENGLDNIEKRSLDMGSGPLIGAPSTKNTRLSEKDVADWHGLRFLRGKQIFFWFWDTAPDWAKAPIIQKALNDAMVAYQAQVTAAKADYAAQVLQDQLDAKAAADEAKAQAKEDAATQRRFEQEEKQTQHDAAVQAVADTQAAEQQKLADEAAARQEASQAELESKAYREQEMTQAEIDQKAFESQASEERKELELLARLAREEAQSGGGDEEGAYADEGGYLPSPEEEGMAEPVEEQGVQTDSEAPFEAEDVLGMFRGINGYRLRRAARNS